LAKKALLGKLPLLLSQAPEIYFEAHRRGGEIEFRQKTQMDWDKLLAIYPDQPLANLDRIKAKEYISERLKKGIKTTSVQRELNTLKAIFNVVNRERNLNLANPFDSLPIPKFKEDITKRIRLSIEEHKTIIQACTELSDEIRVMVLICSLTGARISEIAGLRIQDLNLDDKTPYIEITEYASRRLKNKNSNRKVPLVNLGVQAIKKILKNTENSVLFPRYANGISVKSDNASAIAAKYIRSLGINKTIHCARHAMRDLLREANVPSDYAYEIGGWGSQRIGDMYGEGHTMEQKMKAILKALKPVLPSGSKK
jgi:integrase